MIYNFDVQNNVSPFLFNLLSRPVKVIVTHRSACLMAKISHTSLTHFGLFYQIPSRNSEFISKASDNAFQSQFFWLVKKGQNCCPFFVTSGVGKTRLTLSCRSISMKTYLEKAKTIRIKFMQK